MLSKINSQEEARQKIVAGVNKLADAVTVSLGPNGRNVIIDKGMEGIVSTKDGVTIAKSITKLEDPVENMGAQLIRQASEKSANVAGDGTTTSTLLAATLVNQGVKHVNNGANAVEIKRGIDTAVKSVVEALKDMSIDITSQEQLKQVATISANNDDEIGALIATAMEKVGREGVVTVEESKTGETSLEVVEGMQFDRGFKSPYFVTDNDNMSTTLDKPYILIYNGKLTQVKEMLPLLERVSQTARPFLIIAEEVEGEALATLIVNKMRGTLKVVAVKAPEFGDRRTQVLEDIAVLTDGTVVSSDKGMKLDKFDMSWLGECRVATIDKNTTTIVDGDGTEDLITARIEELKNQIDNAKSPYEMEKLQERLAKMVGGVAIINVGANTEVELKEKKDRVDDALHATQAAIEEGILPGGGVALLRARKAIKTDDLGAKIVLSSLSMPMTKILTNAGFETPYSVTTAVEASEDGWEGYNIKTDEMTNFLEAGIIDPTKVVRSAIVNASSVAGTILLTDACVYTEKEDGDADEPGFGGMGGMM
ncbi:chaperonin GroEL [bacterium]|nr:chaperonin GroEL [bacterium]